MAKQNKRFVACLAGFTAQALAAVMSHVSLSETVSRLSLPANSQMVTLQIDLALDNTSLLMEKLKNLSTPSSPNYGKWLTKEEVDALFPPTDGASAAVTSWLRGYGVERIHEEGSNIKFAAPVETLNRLLNTTFAYYNVAGSRKLRTTEYSVPEAVAPFVQLIHPTTFFGQTKSHHMPISAEVDSLALLGTEAGAEEDCKRLITPPCLRSAYNIGDYVPSAGSGSRIGFGSFLNESARLEDLRKYQRTFGIPEPGLHDDADQRRRG
ncbi:hypothetical protein CIB48_g2449 [Xylaria polymorpha]|nr:hypothetical protein CIB48_g2449 [Xylaria polymorpha]